MIFVLWLQSDLAAMEEIVLLRQRVAQLQERLDNEAADLHQAATIGKQLLEDNSALNKQMEEMASKSSARIKALEQEKYNLINKLKEKAKMEEELLEQIDGLKKNVSESADSCCFNRSLDFAGV